jgi:hypothetical protein
MMNGMVGEEPRTFRNWQAIAYLGVGLAAFLIAGIAGPRPVWYAVVPLALLLVGATRQHVIVYGTELELHNVFRHRRIALSQVQHLGVIYSRGWHYGWRIRVHYTNEQADTFAFVNLAGFRIGPGTFAAPPVDAPAPVKELYALLVARSGLGR